MGMSGLLGELAEPPVRMQDHSFEAVADERGARQSEIRITSLMSQHIQPQLTHVEQVEPLVLLVIDLGLGIATPGDENIADERCRMTDTRDGHLALGRDGRDGERFAVEEEEIVPDRFRDEPAEEKEVAGGRRDGRRREAVPRKGHQLRKPCLGRVGRGKVEKAAGPGGQDHGVSV